MNYNPYSGESLSPEITQDYKLAGAILEKALAQMRDTPGDHGAGELTRYYEGWLQLYRTDFNAGPLDRKHIPQKLESLIEEVHYIDFSNELPKGYGYVLRAEGGAGTSVMASVVYQKYGNKQAASQIKLRRTKELYSGD